MEEQNNTVKALLQQGIAAIKAKDKSLARALLSQASELNPSNAAVWFWLSAALEDPYQQEQAILKVLDLEPDNSLAAKGLVMTQKRIINDAFQRGTDAVQDNNPEAARNYLAEVVDRAPDNIAAWELLSQVAETSEDQEICFENILSLDPGNEIIREKLTQLTQTREMAELDPWAVVNTEDAAETIMHAPTLAGDILGREYIEKYTTILPEPVEVCELPSIALWARYNDPLGCPYCANPTELKQRHCPACKKPLWVSNNNGESRSTLLWFVIMLQAFATVILAVVPLIILFVVAQQLSIFNFFSLIPAYLGRPSPLTPAIISAAFDVLPKRWFFLSWLPALLTLIFAILLYLRWAPVYLLMIVSAVLGFAGSIAVLAGFPAFDGSLYVGALGAILSLVTLLMIMKLENDFRRTHHRYYLELDPDLKEGMAFMLRGKLYARKGLWALAAIHLRRGIALLPYDAGSYLATAVACSQLHDYKLARIILEDAQRMDPTNTRIQEALAVLSTAQTEDSATEETSHIDHSKDTKPGDDADDSNFTGQDAVAKPGELTGLDNDSDIENSAEYGGIAWTDSEIVSTDLVNKVDFAEQTGSDYRNAEIFFTETISSETISAETISYNKISDDVTSPDLVADRADFFNQRNLFVNNEPVIDYLSDLVLRDDEDADDSPQLSEPDYAPDLPDTLDPPSKPAGYDEP